MSRLRELLDAGKTALGTHVMLGECAITELLGNCGYDYLWIDAEHAPTNTWLVQQHLIAARASGASAIVRVPWNDPVLIKPILDMGPDGIVVPMVNSYDEALNAVRAFHYPPNGIRGYGPQRAARYGLMPDYLTDVAKRVLCIVQVEHIQAVQSLSHMVTIPEIDVFLLGVCDLAASMGYLGDWDALPVQETIDAVADCVHAAGKKLGLSCGPQTAKQLADWKRRGIDMISSGSDTGYLAQGASAMLATLQANFTDL